MPRTAATAPPDRRLSRLLAWCLLWCCWGSAAATVECPAPQLTQPPPSLSLRDRGGLGSLVSSAEATRGAIIPGDLPYAFIGTKAREAYNGSQPLTTSLFIPEWASYTQNALFVGGFVLFVGILMPVAAMALWTFCECCYEEDEEEEQENRNLTWKAQVVVWSLAGALVAVLVVMLVMVGILLGANSWMTEGVTRGRAVVRRTIPQLVELRDSSLETLEEILVDQYNNLIFDLQTTILDGIPATVSKAVLDQHSSAVDSVSEDVEMLLSRWPRLLSLTDSVIGNLSTLHTLTSSLNHSLTVLDNTCSLLSQEDNSSLSPSFLHTACEEYSLNLPRLTPFSHWNELGGVSAANGKPHLAQLLLVLNERDFSESASVPLAVLQEYLSELALNLSTLTNSTADSFFSSLGANLTAFTDEVTFFYLSSLPLDSQPQVEEYLGAKHLGNWEWFRSALTITFAVLIFAGSLPLLLALARGLYFVTATFHYSDSAEYTHGAHQAGMFIKRVAFSLSVVCILSAGSTGICLSVAGVMGKACGNHNNFSELLENVVDNPSVWAESDYYPLAAVLLNISNYHLRVTDAIHSCRSNVSLFHTFHLEQRYDLMEHLRLHPLEKILFREQLQDIHLHLSESSLVSPEFHQQNNTLFRAAAVPVEWAELTSLTNTVEEEHANLQKLRERIEDIVVAVSSVNVSEELSVNVSEVAEGALGNVGHLLDQFQPSVSAVSRNASELRLSLEDVHNLSLSHTLSQLSAQITLNATTTSNTLLTLAGSRIITKLDSYLKTSISNLTCDIGTCQMLAADFDTFSSSVCGDIVPGFDLYWTVLIITLSLSLLLMYLSLLVASRFVTPELWRSTRKNPKFYITGAVTRQGYDIAWQLASLVVYLWWIVYLAQDEVVREELCSGRGGCCRDCVWGFGTLFLVLSVVVGGAFRAYQCFTIYMTMKCKAMKYRRFWIDRKKAVNFYSQLTLVFLQDLPFLILVALSSSELGFLSVPIFYCLSVSLLSIISRLVFLVRQRNSVPAYWAWLKLEMANLGLVKRSYTPNQDLPPSANGGVTGLPRRGRVSVGNGHVNPMRVGYEGGGSGSDHSENSSQGTFQEHHEFEFHPPRLSDIPEYPEGGLDATGPRSIPGGGMVPGPPRIMPFEPNFNDDESEMSETGQFQSRVRLDRDIDPNSEAYLQRRRDAIEHFERGGVRIAPAHYHHRDMETSTVSDSYYYGSRNSLELHGYLSSSHAPDTYSYYDSSDYRDEDGDSVYSQSQYHLPVPPFMGEVTVDV